MLKAVPACQSICTFHPTSDHIPSARGGNGTAPDPRVIGWPTLPSSNTLREHGSLPGGFVRLFVNADDLGMSRAVNDEIFDLLRLGLIDSASIIANAPYAEAAIK